MSKDRRLGLHYSDMTPIEKSKLIDELFFLRKADQELMESEHKRIETERKLMESDSKRLGDLLDSFQTANVELRGLRVQLSELLNQLATKDAENVSLREELKLSRKNLYCNKSQRGCSSKKKDLVSREESKDDFDGTSGSIPCCGDKLSPSGEAGPRSTTSPKEVRSLQSDGYNVYMYLDDRLMDTEHLCCMAHARAKFKYAFEQSDDKDAGYILGCIGELYGLEREYEQGKLSPEQIRVCRQGLKTKEIIGRLRSKLNAMLWGEHPPRGES